MRGVVTSGKDEHIRLLQRTYEQDDKGYETPSREKRLCIPHRTSYLTIQLQNKYKDLCIVIRLWRHLLALKRSGRAHDPFGAARTEPGELCVECPACPHPERNLPLDWDVLPYEKRYDNRTVRTVSEVSLPSSDGSILSSWLLMQISSSS